MTCTDRTTWLSSAYGRPALADARLARAACQAPGSDDNPAVRLLPHLSCDGPTQMAIDESLLACAQEPCLRTYRWQPACVSLGYFQDYQAIRELLPVPDMPVVRRITGGGAIWHDAEVTYCLVARLGAGRVPERVRDLYPLIHGAIQTALKRLQVPTQLQTSTTGDRRYQEEPRCFASPAADDLVGPSGGKMLGSAGRVRAPMVLVHGSLKLDSNPWDRERVAGCGLDAKAAASLIEHAIPQAIGMVAVTSEFTVAELTARQHILHDRYATDAWVRERQGPRP